MAAPFHQIKCTKLQQKEVIPNLKESEFFRSGSVNSQFRASHRRHPRKGLQILSLLPECESHLYRISFCCYGTVTVSHEARSRRSIWGRDEATQLGGRSGRPKCSGSADGGGHRGQQQRQQQHRSATWGEKPAQTPHSDLQSGVQLKLLGNAWCRAVFSSFLACIFLLPDLAAGSTVVPDCTDLVAYYAPLAGLKGVDLQYKMHDIIKDHKVFPYFKVWNALKVLDEAEDDPSSVTEIYTLKKVPKRLQANTEGWNREHLWPRSYGLVLGKPEFSDLQNLRPSDVNVNSSRGNKYFGECTKSVSEQCLVPANKEAAPDTGANRKFWMPPEEVRGDIARALMYMAVRYGSGQPPGSPKLQLSDSPSIGSATMGRLTDLLQWHEIDPPSDAEKLRNGRVCSAFQHNRNPFIDHPEYAALIWGAPDSEQRLHSLDVGESGRKVN